MSPDQLTQSIDRQLPDVVVIDLEGIVPAVLAEPQLDVVARELLGQLCGLVQQLQCLGSDGRVREELRAAVASPSAEERESWARLPSGAEMMAEAGAAEVTPGAAEEFWERTGAEPAVDVNMLASGEPRTVIPSVARAQLLVRARNRAHPRPECRSSDPAGSPCHRGESAR